MTNSILRSVRFAFVTLLLGLTVFTVVESAVAGGRVASTEGLAACGSPEQPCLLAPVSVSVNARPEAARLASSEPMPRMMVRVGS
jgi:hypothetical protein